MGAAGEGAELAGVDPEADPAIIVDAVNRFVARGYRKRRPRGIDFWVDRALPLGACWGEQLVRRLRWQWASVALPELEGGRIMGVFDRSRSKAIFPFHYVFGCFENKVPPTILLAFNMLVDRKLPKFKPGSFTNVMAGVGHIVPPE